ncbi:hypothetical protein J4E89_006589 [Alternaria sp. Ai002NY15]|nr:hypothetical protein J4E89_006589 [Alternaria sp. Ai002NY15]
MATPVQTEPTQNANESKVKKTSKKRQLDEDEADYTIDTPGARDITASKRGSCHTAVAKLKMSGKMAKNDMMRKDTVQGSMLSLLFHGLLCDLVIAGPNDSAWKVPRGIAMLYSQKMSKDLSSPMTQTIKMLNHPPHAIDCCVAHIKHVGDYRVVKMLDQHQLYHATTPPSTKTPIPKGITASHIHVDVLILAIEWQMENLRHYAHIELANSLGKPSSPTFDEFEKLVLDTGIFTAKYCKAPICDDTAVNNALTALGTYAALHNETWFKTRRIAYSELLPKAPYLSKYRDLALADLPEFIQAHHLAGKKARLTDSGRGFEDVRMRSSMLMDTEE